MMSSYCSHLGNDNSIDEDGLDPLTCKHIQNNEFKTKIYHEEPMAGASDTIDSGEVKIWMVELVNLIIFTIEQQSIVLFE